MHPVNQPQGVNEICSLERTGNDRREVRIHCRLNVEFRLGSICDHGVCWNLGLHGMYIAHDGDICQGESIEVSFMISDEYPTLVEGIGRVVWVNSGPNRFHQHMPEGFGLEFLQISESDLDAIARFIAYS